MLLDDHNVLLSDEVVYATMKELPQKANWHQFQAHLTYQLPSHIPPVFTDIEFLSGKLSLVGEDDTVSFKYCIKGPGDIQIIQMGSSIAIAEICWKSRDFSLHLASSCLDSFFLSPRNYPFSRGSYISTVDSLYQLMSACL